MEDRLSRLESEVAKLFRAVDQLKSRLDRLESGSGRGASGEAAQATSKETPSPVSGAEISGGITLAGRTLLVLGGGYFLRAMTETGTLSPIGGVALGLIYTLVWIFMAERAGAAGRTLSAAFHGAGAILVAYPLLWETTARFELLAPSVAAACLCLVSLAAVAVAWRWRLRGLAWVSVMGATMTSFALIAGTRELAPFTLYLVGLSLATYWLAQHGGWPFVHWPVAGLAAVAVTLVGVGVLIDRSNVSRTMAVTIHLGLTLGFLSSFGFRLLEQSRSPGGFEIVQSGIVLVLGDGGSLAIAVRGDGPLKGILSVFGIVAALVGYRLSVASPTLPSRGRSYLEGTAAGLLLVACLALSQEPTLLLSVAAVGLTWFGARLERTTLSLQGTLFLLGAAITSGIVVQGAYAFLAPAETQWPTIDRWWLVAFAAAAAAYLMSNSGASPSWWDRWRLAKLMLLSVLVLALGGALLAALVPFIAGRPSVAGVAGGPPSPSLLATLRTAVLAGSSLALAFVSKVERFREAGWLIYPLLLAGGIKLVVEDFPRGEAATLFVALALYGGAAFVAPRLASRKS